MASRHRLADWREYFDFTDEAERNFDNLPEEVRKAFVEVFPTFVRHPWRPSVDLDVSPVRNTPDRWRLKVPGGHRGIYYPRHGRPAFEMFETRDQVYERAIKHLQSLR
jgi:hypothetical protein